MTTGKVPTLYQFEIDNTRFGIFYWAVSKHTYTSDWVVGIYFCQKQAILDFECLVSGFISSNSSCRKWGSQIQRGVYHWFVIWGGWFPRSIPSSWNKGLFRRWVPDKSEKRWIRFAQTTRQWKCTQVTNLKTQQRRRPEFLLQRLDLRCESTRLLRTN